MFSRRVRFAFHCVGYLACHPSPSPAPFSEILEYLKAYGRDINLSASYIQKILVDLARVGLVVGATGPKGGYSLARPPESISLKDVVAAIDGIPLEGCCLMALGPCDLDASCEVRDAMQRAEKAFYESLASESVWSLARSMLGDAEGMTSPAGKTGRGGKGARKAAPPRK